MDLRLVDFIRIGESLGAAADRAVAHGHSLYKLADPCCGERHDLLPVEARDAASQFPDLVFVRHRQPTTPHQVIEAVSACVCGRLLHCREDGTLTEAEALRIEIDVSARLPKGGSIVVRRTHDVLRRNEILARFEHPAQESFTVLVGSDENTCTWGVLH